MTLTVDADAEHRRQEAQEVLAAASAVLGRSLDLREAARAIAHAAIPHFADWAVVDAFDEDGRLTRLALVHVDPAQVAAAEEVDRRWPPDLEGRTGSRAVLVRGEPLFLNEVRDEDFAPLARDAEHLAAWKAFRVRSCIAVPLEAAGERLGVLTLFAVEGGRRYTREDVVLATELGRRAASSLVNARLFARERRAHAETTAARDRTERLQQLSAELTRSLTRDAVVAVVVRHLVTALDASAAGVYELSPDGQEFGLLGSAGVGAAQRPRIERVPADTPLPLGGIMQSREPVLIEDSRVWLAEHPLAPVMPGNDVRAWAALPLRVDEDPEARLLGGLTVAMPGPRTFSHDERGFLQAFADLCAQALERARLYEAERRARERAEALQALASALTRAATAEEVADVVITLGIAAMGARFSVLSLLDAEGRTFTMVAAPGVPEDLVTNWRQFPNTGDFPAAVAARTGRPCYSHTRAEYATRGPGLGVIAEQLEIGATAALPLLVESRVIGVLSLGFSSPREFDAEEDAHLRTLADLCGPALERARLFEAERRARERAEALQALASALALASTATDVADVVVRQGMSATGTRCAVVSLLDAEARTFTIVAAPGAPEEFVGIWRQFPNDGEISAAVAARTKRPCYSHTRAEYVARGPGLDIIAERVGIDAEASLPLIVEGRVIGVLSLEFSSPREFDAEEDAHLRTLADLCGPAFERARLYEVERARVAAEAARAEAEAASRAKDELLAVVSHELRAPLAPARALAQVLARSSALALEHREMANEIDRHIAYEARLIGDLLNYERATRGMLALRSQRCDVHEIASRALRLAADVFQAQHMPVDLDFTAEDAIVWADPIRVREILYNLLVNASKFSSRGAPVVVRTRNAAPDWIEIQVIDAGHGIAPEHLPRLFEPFTRLDALLESGEPPKFTSGLGLGLALSRWLAEAQGGTLTAASAGRGAGATFTLRLPTVPVSSLAEGGMVPRTSGASRIITPPPASDAVPERGLRVLVLENDAAAARALRRLLATDGHTVFVAEDLTAAERIAGAEALDVLLCDLHLGAETGLDAPRRVAEAVRRRDGAAPPAVVLSGYDRAIDLAESQAAGFVAHLAKPVEEELLFQTLRRAAREATH